MLLRYSPSPACWLMSSHPFALRMVSSITGEGRGEIYCMGNIVSGAGSQQKRAMILGVLLRFCAIEWNGARPTINIIPPIVAPLCNGGSRQVDAVESRGSASSADAGTKHAVHEIVAMVYNTIYVLDEMIFITNVFDALNVWATELK